MSEPAILTSDLKFLSLSCLERHRTEVLRIVPYRYRRLVISQRKPLARSFVTPLVGHLLLGQHLACGHTATEASDIQASVITTHQASRLTLVFTKQNLAARHKEQLAQLTSHRPTWYLYRGTLGRYLGSMMCMPSQGACLSFPH